MAVDDDTVVCLGEHGIVPDCLCHAQTSLFAELLQAVHCTVFLSRLILQGSQVCTQPSEHDNLPWGQKVTGFGHEQSWLHTITGCCACTPVNVVDLRTISRGERIMTFARLTQIGLFIFHREEAATRSIGGSRRSTTTGPMPRRQPPWRRRSRRPQETPARR